MGTLLQLVGIKTSVEEAFVDESASPMNDVVKV